VIPAVPSPGIVVRFEPMQVEDLEAVLAIEQESFTTPWSRAMFLSELANARVAHLLVARVGEGQGDVVGYLGYHVVVDEMHIVIVAVHPAWRRRGIARVLMRPWSVRVRLPVARRPWKCASPIPGRSSCITAWALHRWVPAPGITGARLKMP
jgi:GNAT superfamily N-acetyltransferase